LSGFRLAGLRRLGAGISTFKHPFGADMQS
jgi:hypothetical protein